MDIVSTDKVIWEIIHLDVMGEIFSEQMDLQWYLLKHTSHFASREKAKKKNQIYKKFL